MQEGVESIGKLVIACRQAPELFEAIEESLDKISRLVAMPVDSALGIAVTARWDDDLDPAALNGSHQSIAIVALVSDDSSSRNRRDQGRALRHIRHLTGRQNEANRIAQRIDASMDLGRQSAP